MKLRIMQQTHWGKGDCVWPIDLKKEKKPKKHGPSAPISYQFPWQTMMGLDEVEE